MIKRSILVAIGIFFFSSANAALVQGVYLGTFSGNDSEAALLEDLGLDVNELAKVDTSATSNDGLTISNLLFNDDDEPISGEWSYSGAGTVGYIVIKASDMYAVYDYTNADMLNMGIWDTLDVENRGLSHITAYEAKVVPVPAALWLMISGLTGLGLMRRRK